MRQSIVARSKDKKLKTHSPSAHKNLNGSKEPQKSSSKNKSQSLGLPKDLIRNIHRLMVKSRALEERLIKIYKAGEAYFWIGAPGEEAFGVPLGLLVNKGQGNEYDWLHLHYRATPTLVSMGMEMVDSVRLTMNRSSDPCTGGRNFSNHYCFPKWNVAPITSPIEVQYLVALGTARAQSRRKNSGITIITGGDAGTAEGDFASCLIWASRPRNELPMLITVQNNRWGISTSYDDQHGEASVADRGKAFGIRTAVINGNDPIETYIRLGEEMQYIRKNRKPVLLEANVSRLYGHSSASGANRVPEVDCLQQFEQLLLKKDLISEKEIRELWTQYESDARAAQDSIRDEPAPSADSIWDHVYSGGENSDWRKF